MSLRINAGESVGLVGESGSGKTMLSLALMGLLPPGAHVSGEATLAAESSVKKLTALSEHEWREVRGGQFVEVGPAEVVHDQPKNPYTRELLAAVPELPRG